MSVDDKDTSEQEGENWDNFLTPSLKNKADVNNNSTALDHYYQNNEQTDKA